jgi:hypothetical protein
MAAAVAVSDQEIERRTLPPAFAESLDLPRREPENFFESPARRRGNVG